MTDVVVIYHSARGHTRTLAEAVVEGAREGGARTRLVDVEQLDEAAWRAMADADALIFGCPTWMGSVSGPFKTFMDQSSRRAWVTQLWKDKLAAGFTNSSAASGDKLSTLMQLTVFAAQHSMIWVSLGLMPGNTTSRGRGDELNRLGSHLGAMAQSNLDQGPELAPPDSDRRTAAHLGRRVAELASRFATVAPAPSAGFAGTSPCLGEDVCGSAANQPPPQTGGDVAARRQGGRHPTTAHWRFPPPGRPAELPCAARSGARLERVNLRELGARPGRLEHHLMPIAEQGDARLELTVASEPLAFGHQNLSDEYHVALPTGDALLESLSVLTLLSDAETGQDVGRYRHRLGELVLHPFGLQHWPGRLRSPHRPFEFGPGMRRTGLSLLFCGRREIEPDERPLFVSQGREDAVKAYTDAPLPLMLADIEAEAPRVLARVGDTQLDLLVPSAGDVYSPACGGFVIVLEAEADATLFSCDLVRVPPGASLALDGVVRALAMSSATAQAEDVPRTWQRVPRPPMVPFEQAEPGTLPLQIGEMTVEAVDEDGEDGDALLSSVRVTLPGGSAEIPRYWLARTTFRVALHDYGLGYVETYGGFFFDHRGGRHRLGVRGLGAVELDARELPSAIEALYRAVAPAGYYREDLR